MTPDFSPSPLWSVLFLLLLAIVGCTVPTDPVTTGTAGAIPVSELPGVTSASEASIENEEHAARAQILSEPAERFVRLSLALGLHDSDYVDAYSGPQEWRTRAEAEHKTLTAIIAEAEGLSRAVTEVAGLEGIAGKRQRFLAKQFSSLAARARVVSGETLQFDQESQALYDATAPTHTQAYFERALQQLSEVLPGSGSVAARLEAFREDFVIKPERLDAVFSAAIKECRRRTLEYIELPAHESFTVEYVTDKAWSGYNWFQGDARSLIQVNTDFPILIDRAVDLACHEGYPGHHVYNTLLETSLLKQRGWSEFYVFPLFSPTGLIAEGSANYGIEMAFSREERLKFESTVIFPLARLDGSRVAEFYSVQEALEKLKYAGNYTARRYLNGEVNAEQAAEELQRYALMVPDKARQRVRFIDKYRSYVINYNLGRDIVAAWIERDAASDAERWQRFVKLLSEPTLPSELTAR